MLNDFNDFKKWTKEMDIRENLTYKGKGFRKVKTTVYKKPCLHPEHNPPAHIVLSPGTWEWSCPSCGQTIRFEVPEILCTV